MFSTLSITPDQSSTQPPPSQTCSPIQKVGFAKTHKTASSTVQNILMRFVLHSQWNFVMYNAGSHLGPPRNQYRLDTPFQASWVDNTDWQGMVEEQGYNVMALHTMWDQQEVEKVLGNGSDVRFITILRNPVDQFESMYNYVHFEETFHMDLETFINVYLKPGLKVDRVHGYLGRNQQLWDLGLTNTEDPALVEEKVQELDRDFDLVMIAEELEESLVVLSNELCWPLVNMTSLKLNTRKPSTVSSLSPESRSLLQSWLWADTTLYTYFKDKLHRKKLELGVERMGSQVETLRTLNTQMEEECVIQVVNDTKSLAEEFQPWSKDVLGFRINEKRKDCAYFGMAEISFIDTLRDKQRERLTLWKLVPSWVSRLVPWVTEG